MFLHFKHTMDDLGVKVVICWNRISR